MANTTSPILQNVGSPNLRIDYGTANAYTRPEASSKTFIQRMALGVGKSMTFLGPVGGAVAAVTLGPAGLPVAAGMYGLSKVSADQVYQSKIRDQIQMASEAKPGPVVLPGLFETQAVSPGETATTFMAPKSMEPQISDVIVNREMAAAEARTKF